LLVPDGDLSALWDAETTIDEAGNRAGVPDTPSQTEAVLEASGHQIDTGDNRSLEILTLRGGFPGEDGAAFGWKQTAGAAQDYRGWDIPLSVAQLEAVDYDVNDEHNLHLHLISKTNTDGSDHLFCFSDFESGGNLRVQINRRDSGGWLGGLWPKTIATTTQPYGGLYCYPTGLVLPSGRLLVFYLTYNTEDAVLAGAFFANVRMSYSDDNASSWVQGSIFCLDSEIGISPPITPSGDLLSPHKMRVAYKDGQILLLIWFRQGANVGTDRSGIVQYASDDLGTSFVQVSSSYDTGADVSFPDITAAGDNFVVGWINEAGGEVRIATIGSAYETLNWAAPQPTWATASNSRASTSSPDWQGIEADAELALTTDEDGTVYLYAFSYPYSAGGVLDLSSGTVYRSASGGLVDSFSGLGHGFGSGTAQQAFNIGTFFKPMTNDAGAPYIKPLDLTAAPHRGRIAVAHRAIGGDGQQSEPIQIGAGGTLYVYYMGGYTQVCLPSLGTYSRQPFRSCYGSTWFPYTIPGDASGGILTEIAAGVPTLSAIVSPGRYRLQTPPGVSYYFEDNLNPSGVGFLPSQVDFYVGLLGMFTYEVNSAPSTQNVAVLVAEGGGGGVEISMVITDTGIAIFDGISGAPLATISPPFGALNTKIQVLWAIRGTGDPPAAGDFSLWFRLWDANEDRTWTHGTTINTLTFGASPADSRIRWGDTELVNPSDQFWDEFQYAYGSVDDFEGRRFNNVGLQLSNGQQNPGDLFGRPYAPTPLYVDSNVRVASVDGPTFEADNWAVNVRHLQGGENVIPSVSPSPAKLWRSQTAPAGASIAFQRNPDTQDAWAGNDFYAIHFENVNFKRAALEYRIGGAWVPVTTIQLFRVFNFSRNGHTIRPLGGDSGGFYAYYNEFKGLKFEFNPDGQGSEVATIARNSEGVAYTGTNAKPATIFLDPETFDHTTAPASGVAHVWFRNITVLVPRSETPFEGIRLNLCPTGTLPPEAYYEAGQIIPGTVAVFGWDYSRERNITKTPNVEINTLRDGTRHAYKAGEPRRRVRFSWAEGVDVTQLRTEWGGGADPDYVKIAATGTPAALRSDGELLMWGLLDRIDGPGLPVVYIPKIDFSQNGDPSYDPRQYARGAIYGRTMTPVTMETVLGSEEVDEVYRLNSVTIEEEL
jgi:hypothetical protein